MSKKKRAKSEFTPKVEKRPRIDQNISPENIEKKTLIWRLKFVDMLGPWGWFNIKEKDKGVLLDIRNRLGEFERMTWGEIGKKNQNHPIPVDKIANKAQKRLKEINLDFVENLYSLRITKQSRLWGYRDNNMFYILWWDPEHTVYSSKKR